MSFVTTFVPEYNVIKLTTLHRSDDRRRVNRLTPNHHGSTSLFLRLFTQHEVRGDVDACNNCQQRFAAFRICFAAGRADIRFLGLVSSLQDFRGSAEDSSKLCTACDGVPKCAIISTLRNLHDLLSVIIFLRATPCKLANGS